MQLTGAVEVNYRQRLCSSTENIGSLYPHLPHWNRIFQGHLSVLFSWDLIVNVKFAAIMAGSLGMLRWGPVIIKCQDN